MLRRIRRLLRLDRLERRLFGWLLLLTLVPLLTLLAAGYVVGARSLQWVGTLGPWDQVAESGRALMDAAAAAAADDPALAQAVERHRRELSSSVLLARRWSFLLDRLAATLPFLMIGFATLMVVAVLMVGRRLSVQLARPILELAGWAGRMARGDALPPPTEAEQEEVREVRVLRDAMRTASVRIADARSRAVEAERVKAWGEMARRVAHEMKNPLTPLRLAAHRLARHPDAAGGLREPLEVIEQETGRLDELARQFAVLGRPSTGPASDVDVVELLERLLQSDVPPGITTDVAAAPGVPLIRAHFDALQRAFRNLIRNAVEAIGEERSRGGGNGAAAHRIAVTIRPTGGGTLAIAIADTGCGIPPERAERLFEPDFTLKAGGTGLGLAVVRQAVAAHGGSVRAEPGAGAGAVFTVELPLDGVRAPAAGSGGGPAPVSS